MKVIALNYSYDLKKLSDIGRVWAKDVYVNKDFISEYSSASYATFIDKNPDLVLNLYTDDIDEMKKKMLKYNINQNNIVYHDYTENLKKYKNNLRYSFDVLNDFIHFARSRDEFTVKIDNDLIFTGSIPKINDVNNDVLVWEYERLVLNGDPRMGEVKVSSEVIGNINYPIYNLGLFGIPPSYPEEYFMEIYEKMVSVDIIDVSDLNVHTWHCAEQTANNWIFYKKNYNIIQTNNIVKHHYSDKKQCINDAKYLLK
jgi:hypothetical protein